MKTSLVTLRGTLVASTAALLFAFSTTFAAGPAPERDQRRFEIHFLTEMIDHHYGAVKMAELCDGRTVHDELHQLCHSMRTMQSAEIAMMQGWLRDWYGVTHEPELRGKMRRDVDRLAQREGAAFEQEFMSMMIRHHASALEMGPEALLQAWHAELLNMVAKMMGGQSDEIVQMRLWLMTWYRIADLDHADRR